MTADTDERSLKELVDAAIEMLASDNEAADEMAKKMSSRNSHVLRRKFRARARLAVALCSLEESA